MKGIMIIYLILFPLVIFAQSDSIHFSANISYNGSYASGSYRIYRSNNYAGGTLSSIQSPLIFIEGFDPNGDYNLSTLDNNIYGILNRSPNYLGYTLRNMGYDIIVLNFDNGGDYIQKNAFLLTELINRINANKTGNEQLVVVGFSMGGLVARYALTYMEEHGMNHNTRLYVSYDSPHKGAHIPVGLQRMAKLFDTELFRQFIPDLQKQLNNFVSPAATQMLQYNLLSNTGSGYLVNVSTLHQNFINEINSLNNCNGFPKSCRSIGISLGSWNSKPQTYTENRDNLDGPDPQHSGYDHTLINLKSGSACALQTVFTFQVALATSISNNYPYYSLREQYTGNVNNVADATLYYNNVSESPVYPVDFNTIYNCNNQPIDFAPGSNIAIYKDIIDGLGTYAQCSFSRTDNATFVPTISALAFDTDNLFYDISNDVNMLQKTPFDAIYGLSNNTSHRTNQTGNTGLVNWLVNQINSTSISSSKSCDFIPTQICNGTSVTFTNNNFTNTDIKSYSQSITAQDNVTVKNGANIKFLAGQNILFGSGFRVEEGAHFSADIQTCINPSGGRLEEQIEITPSSYLHYEREALSIISASPNPATNSVTFYYTLDNEIAVNLYISDVIGRVTKHILSNSKRPKGRNEETADISALSPGVYFYTIEIENSKRTKRLVIN